MPSDARMLIAVRVVVVTTLLLAALIIRLVDAERGWMCGGSEASLVPGTKSEIVAAEILRSHPAALRTQDKLRYAF